MVNHKSYKLDSLKTLEYIKWHLEELNLLSESVLEFTPFERGEFFTYLNEGIEEKQLYGFKYGGVAKGVGEKILILLENSMKNNFKCICIFDDFEEEYKISDNWELFQKIGVHYHKEIYYLIEDKEKNEQLIKEALQASDVIWHSLCVLSRYPYIRNKDQIISKEELEQIAKNAEIILVLAYDAESYIIWKKNSP